MRYEQRICDRCGKTSALLRVREPNPNRLLPLLPMEQRGWGLVDNQDLCPDCMWMHDFEEAA